MAHFVQLDEANIVIQVIVVNNDCVLNKQGFEDEQVGIAFCQSLYGNNTRWVQTSYNGSFRGRYAGIGFLYDSTKDEFVAPSEPSEVIND